jgi:hypothetical protein
MDRIFRLEVKEVRKLHSEKLRNSYFSLNINWVCAMLRKMLNAQTNLVSQL